MRGKNTRGKNKQHQSGSREREMVASEDLVLKEKSPILCHTYLYSLSMPGSPLG